MEIEYFSSLKHFFHFKILIIDLIAFHHNLGDKKIVYLLTCKFFVNKQIKKIRGI